MGVGGGRGGGGGMKQRLDVFAPDQSAVERSVLIGQEVPLHFKQLWQWQGEAHMDGLKMASNRWYGEDPRRWGGVYLAFTE